jgi:shikimate dehydrogenase
MITGNARLAGVLGWPVAQSRSPRLHNHWLATHGIDGAYVPLPVCPGDFAAVVDGLRRAGFRGANVTIPHKEAAFAVCDQVDDSARRAGAVNTLVFAEGTVHGSNTDGLGFIANLRAHGVDPAAGPALLLGAGGAARAIAAALLACGTQVTCTNRTPARADTLAAALPGLRVLPWEDRSAALADHALLVNTTSLGMRGHPPLDIGLAAAPPTMAVADIVYVPLQTPLLRQAANNGLRTVPGLGMLLHQAVPGFAAWFGVTPVVDQQVFDLLAADIPPA